MQALHQPKVITQTLLMSLKVSLIMIKLLALISMILITSIPLHSNAVTTLGFGYHAF